MNEYYSIRKLDDLGRVALPIDLRTALSLAPGDSVAITLTAGGETASLRKCRPSCSCCQGTETLKRLPNGSYVCADCLQKLE